MLASLLPGLREIRAPLAAGYLWLAAIWVFITSTSTANTLSDAVPLRLTELTTFFGQAATLAAISFLAYLVGLISLGVTSGASRAAAWLLRHPASRLFRRGAPEDGRGVWAWLSGRLTTTAVREPAERTVLARLDRRLLRDATFRAALRDLLDRSIAADQNDVWVELQTMHRTLTGDERKAFALHASFAPFPLPLVIDDEAGGALERSASLRREALLRLVDVDPYVQSVLREVDELPARLLSSSPEVYAAYDRHRAEAAFRSGVVLPLVALCSVLAVSWSPWWLLGLLPATALIALARQSTVAASKQLAEAFAVADDAHALGELETGTIRMRESAVITLPAAAASHLRDHGTEQDVDVRRRLSRGNFRVRVVPMPPAITLSEVAGPALPDVTSPTADLAALYRTTALQFLLGDQNPSVDTLRRLRSANDLLGQLPLDAPQLSAVLTEQLGVRLPDLVLPAIHHHSAVIGALRRTESSSATEVVDLARFTLEVSYASRVDVLTGEVPIGTTELGVVAAMDISGLAAMISNGRLDRLHSGRGPLTVQLTVGDVLIAVRSAMVSLDGPIQADEALGPPA